jgi:aryl-alcohol dehydrogenase-like predicted oxidoreductase
MLAKPYAWDTAQMPINDMDAHYRSFQKEVVPVCLSKKVGVIGMKGLAGGRTEGRLPTKAGVSVEECYRFSLSLPVSSQVVGMTSLAQLEQNCASPGTSPCRPPKGSAAGSRETGRRDSRETHSIDQVPERPAPPQAARFRPADGD